MIGMREDGGPIGPEPMEPDPCRNDSPAGCLCSGGSCLCSSTRTHGADRNLCGCWPEPITTKTERARSLCRCGAFLSPFERRHGLQCRTCTNRDESLYGSGCGL